MADDLQITSPAKKRPLVFISSKSQDYPYALQVYEFLAHQGIPAFFSEISLRKMGKSDFRKEIKKALEEAEHMIVVVSRPEYASFRWVEFEWGSFLNEKLSERKNGNLLTITFGISRLDGLPYELRQNEIIEWNNNGREKLLQYVTGHIDKVTENIVNNDARLSQQLPRAKPRKSIGLWKLLPFGALIILGLVLLVYNVAQYSPDNISKDTSVPQKVLQATLRINSTPPARVYLDGQLVSETTPFISKLDKGKHKIELKKKGYEPHQESLDFTAARDIDVSLQAIPVPPPPLQPQQQPASKNDNNVKEMVDNKGAIPEQQVLSKGPSQEAKSLPQYPSEHQQIYLDTSSIIGKYRSSRSDVYLDEFLDMLKTKFAGQRIKLTPSQESGIPTLQIYPPDDSRIFIPYARDSEGMVKYAVSFNIKINSSSTTIGQNLTFPIRTFGKSSIEQEAIEAAMKNAADDIVDKTITNLTKEKSS